MKTGGKECADSNEDCAREEVCLRHLRQRGRDVPSELTSEQGSEEERGQPRAWSGVGEARRRGWGGEEGGGPRGVGVGGALGPGGSSDPILHVTGSP